MADLEGIKRHIETVKDLQDVVRTMKGLAAVSIRQYERAVYSLADYYRTVELALFVVMRTMPPGALLERTDDPSPRTGVIVFGTDQGMCGQFNEQVVAHVLRTVAPASRTPAQSTFVAVGERIVPRLREEGCAVEAALALPSSITTMPAVVQELLLTVQRWAGEERIRRVTLVHNRHERAGAYQPHAAHLLPLDQTWIGSVRDIRWPTRQLPLHTIEASALFSACLRQYFFVCLYRALAESLASENAARLNAMQAAEKNIEERLDLLHADFHSQRQMTITEELLDIVGGFEALRST